MKKLFILIAGLFCTFSSLADPAVKNVQVNIHNNTASAIELKSFTASRLFASTRIGEETIEPFASEYNAIFFTSFDQKPINAGVDILIDGAPMKLMWQTNMGFDEPDGPKSHLCGVIKDNTTQVDQEYCHIPYVEGDTLFVDFNITTNLQNR